MPERFEGTEGSVSNFFLSLLCNVSHYCVRRSNVVERFCGHTAENASRLGYKHVCVNYLHVASHDYQEVIQHTDTHTHPHTHSLTESFYLILVKLPPLFQHKFKRRMKVPNIIESKTHVINRQKMGFESTKVRKANIAK